VNILYHRVVRDHLVNDRRSCAVMSTSSLVQVRAAARMLGVHENTLRRWEQAGLVRAVRLPSGVRRFRREDIEELRAEMYAAPEEHARAAAASLRADESSRE
jgi:excisionase family DNA binding protein